MGGAVLLAGLAGCSNDSNDDSNGGDAAPTNGATSTAPTEPPTTQPSGPPKPQLTVTPAADARDVSVIEPVTVEVSDGKLTEVKVLTPEGREVQGALAADGTQWRSGEPLGYGRTYSYEATATGVGDATAEASGSFTTLKPAQVIFPSFYPAPGLAETMGVGQPLRVIYDKPPVDRVAAEKALIVTTTPKVEGSWYWIDDRTLDYRPQKYWKSGTRITLQAKVYGVHLGNGAYGELDRAVDYTIGDAKVAIVDDTTKMMVVYVNGTVVKQIPVSMGQDAQIPGVDGQIIDLRTQSGIHVVTEKLLEKQMTSDSYGLPSDYDLGYDQLITLAVRISNSGEFVHSAPWSVADQGARNVSHGCINISPEAAQWFYDNFDVGDVVDIRNTGRTLPPTDGFGDWNIPWSEWLAGSAVR